MSNADEHPPSQPGRKGASRFGPSAIVREGPPSEDAQVLPLFASRADAAVPVPERRRSPRFSTAERRAWLGWWAGPGEFTKVAARLDNISQGGARLAVADPPPREQIVWLCLGVPDPTECVQAKVLEVNPNLEGDSGDSVVRIAFGGPCPLNLYRVAIDGLAGQGRAATEGRGGSGRTTHSPA